MTTSLELAGYIKQRLNIPARDSFRIQKLLYFVQAWHFAWTGRPLLKEGFEAWVNGPVEPGVFYANKREQLPTDVELSPEAKSIVDDVLEHYRGLSTPKLVALTHEDAPWIEARKGLTPNQSSDRVLSEKTMLDFYTAKAIVGGDAPQRRAVVAIADTADVETVGAQVIDRWKRGLELLANK